MTRADVQIVEFPYPDDWYDVPEMMGPEMENPSELWLKRDHKHDLAFRPLETAPEKGVIDAMCSQSKVLSILSETTGEFKSIEDLSRYPDWTLQVANVPAGMIKAGFRYTYYHLFGEVEGITGTNELDEHLGFWDPVFG
jgi:hypothetical protein